MKDNIEQEPVKEHEIAFSDPQELIEEIRISSEHLIAVTQEFIEWTKADTNILVEELIRIRNFFDAIIEAKGGVLEYAYQDDGEEKDVSMIDVIINVERQNEENERRRRQRFEERRARQERRRNYRIQQQKEREAARREQAKKEAEAKETEVKEADSKAEETVKEEVKE